MLKTCHDIMSIDKEYVKHMRDLRSAIFNQ